MDRPPADLPGVESEHQHGRYHVEYKGRDVSASHALICAYGKANRLYRIADISNTDVSEVCTGLYASVFLC